MNQINIQYFKTKIGELLLGSYENKLCLLDYRYRRMRTTVDNRIKKSLNANYLEKDNNLLKETRIQLDEFLSGERKAFDIPILTIGTDFQKTVWNALMQVKYGETATYLDLAKSIDNEKAVRAVASANGANSIGLIIPCHRIIGNKNKKYDYKFNTAVKTTGIFCLPSCSAKKPNKENVIFYDTKKEALKNGFRACKVCKP